MEEKKREMNPNSLKNLIPPVPGEVRNPLGINRKPYSLEYQRVSQEPIPEKVRLLWNERFGEEILKPGDTWARGNAFAQHFEAACKGSAHAAQEIREAVEGRATQRVELSGTEGAEQHPRFRVVFEDEVLELSDGPVTPDDLSGK